MLPAIGVVALLKFLVWCGCWVQGEYHQVWSPAVKAVGAEASEEVGAWIV